MSKWTCSLLAAGLALTAAAAHGAEPVEIGNRRELFLDDLLVEQLEGAAQRVFHKPVPREIAITFDKPWEGNSCNYFTVFRDGDLYRMYYRASGSQYGELVAYAESPDGIHWTRPNLGLVEFNGSKENNIVWSGVGSHAWVPFKDDNPDCLPEARYKAVGARFGPGSWAEQTKELVIFQSPDGIRWELIQERAILDDGLFDSQNLAFWDPNIQAYRAYYRMGGRYLAEHGDWGRGGRNIKTATSGRKRGQVQFAGTGRRVLRTNWTCPLFSATECLRPIQVRRKVLREARLAPAPI